MSKNNLYIFLCHISVHDYNAFPLKLCPPMMHRDGTSISAEDECSVEQRDLLSLRSSTERLITGCMWGDLSHKVTTSFFWFWNEAFHTLAFQILFPPKALF